MVKFQKSKITHKILKSFPVILLFVSVLNEFDFMFYLISCLAIVFLGLQVFLKYIDRLIYPDFYEDLDHVNHLKH